MSVSHDTLLPGTCGGSAVGVGGVVRSRRGVAVGGCDAEADHDPGQCETEGDEGCGSDLLDCGALDGLGDVGVLVHDDSFLVGGGSL
jgi:hypothetical protein